MKAFTEYKKGLSKQSASGLVSLLNDYTRKQIGLWITLSIFWLMALFFAISLRISMHLYSAIEIKLIFNSIILIGAIVPAIIIATFSIPATLNTIHKSTMIKRIGATRLTEKSFILITWLFYFVLTIITYSVSFLVFSLIMGQLNISEMIISYIYAIIVISMLVSMGTLLGALPIGTVASISISMILFIFSLVFGGIIPWLTQILVKIIPGVTVFFIFINPIGLATYVLFGITSGTGGTLLITLGTLCILMFSSMMFFGASMIMSFNKIR